MEEFQIKAIQPCRLPHFGSHWIIHCDEELSSDIGGEKQDSCQNPRQLSQIRLHTAIRMLARRYIVAFSMVEGI